MQINTSQIEPMKIQEDQNKNYHGRILLFSVIAIGFIILGLAGMTRPLM
jgi:hypothetical protein